MVKKIKCSLCSKEWYVEEASLNELSICPYCSGAIREKAIMKEFDSLSKAIYGATEEFGTEIFQSPKKLTAYLLDAAPKLKKEIRIFSKALDEKRLLSVKAAFEEDESSAVEGIIERLKYSLIEEEGLSESWAEIIGENLLKAAEYSKGIGIPALFTAKVSDAGDAVQPAKGTDWQQEAADNAPADAFYDYCVAEEFFEKNDYEEAVKYYEQAANKGSDEALIKLSMCYSGGIGIVKNEERAVECLKTAVKHGCAKAKYNLSVCYFQGIGVQKEEKKALKYLIFSAKQGCMEAQYNLAVRCRFGFGIPENRERAIAYYSLAARQGHMHARNVLAGYYQFGWGAVDDEDEEV